MNETKVILLCGSRISLPAMRNLVFYNQLAVVVIPAHCKEFVLEVQHVLRECAIPIITVNKKDFTNQLLQAIKEYQVHVGLMITFTYKLPAAVYQLPKKGFYNMHPGPLPTYRGPDPVFQQIKNREPYAGITIHKVEEEFDKGAVVLTDKIRLSVNDTYGLLTEKLGETAARLIDTLMKMAALDIDIPMRRQDETKVVYYKRQSAPDITINWETMTADDIIALVNACNPWNKGAVTRIGQKVIRILEAEKILVAEKAKLPLQNAVITSADENGVIAATLGGELLRITYIYTDEGFLHTSRMLAIGLSPGDILG